MTLPRLEDVRRDIMRRSFYRFVKEAWKIVEPGRPFIENWHIGALCEHAQAVAEHQIQFLICNQPPGTAKSTIWAVLWPAWIWTWNPGFRGIFSSYESTLASRDSFRCRNIIKSKWYQQLFVNGAWQFLPYSEERERQILGINDPAWTFDPNQDEKTYYQNTATGVRQALSVGAGGTGFRGDGILVDDPHSRKQAFSKIKRQEAITWWDETMSTRLNDVSIDWRVVVGQRFHVGDLSGYLLAQGGYQHLNLPSEYDPKRSCVTIRLKEGQRIEWRDPRKVKGELLFPQRFPREALDRLRKQLKERGYAGQHQQDPINEGGQLFKREYWRFWKPDGVGTHLIFPRPKDCYKGPARPLPAKFDQIIISCDFTFKDTEASDFVDMKVIGRLGADRFILDRVHKQMGFRETMNALKGLCGKWPLARKKLIEDKANGPGIINMLKTQITGLIAFNPDKYGSKEERASLAEPEVASGNWYLPEGAPWLDEFVFEFEVFPNGDNDDEVDTLTQAACDFMQIGPAARAGMLCAPTDSSNGILTARIV